ncbi:MAG: hypothetical protein WB424_11655 [Terracidiphilus sp.]
MNLIKRKKTDSPVYVDEAQWDVLAIFTHIEAHPDTPQSRRVEAILELLSCLRDDVGVAEKLRVRTGLRNCLRRYRWESYIERALEGFREIRVIANRENLSADDAWEYEAVRVLLDLVPYLGNPPRIRRCAECPRWIFAAKRNTNKWCGSVCRQRHYDRDPETRAKKLEAMRKRYATEKERDRKRKISVGFREQPAKRRKAGTP